MSKKPLNIWKLTKEQIVDYVTGLFNCSVGIMDRHKINDRFNIMVWGTWSNMLDTYDIDPEAVNVLYFYDQIGRIEVIRKEDTQKILDLYHETRTALAEVKPEDPAE